MDISGPPLSPRELQSRLSELKIADVHSKGNSPSGIAVSVQMQTYSKVDEVFDGSGMKSVRL
jgi:hypothetical protein